MSKILCPYCRKEIDETEKICPFCTTKLTKDDYKKLLFALGAGLYILWFIANIAGFLILNRYPQILTIKNKDNELMFSLIEYVEICIQPAVIILVPFIIAIVKKYKIKESSICIITIVLTLIIFISYFIHLQKAAGV